MTSSECLILEVADPTAAERFYTTAFGLGAQLVSPDPDGFAWEAV